MQLWSIAYRSAGKKFQYEGEEHTIEETSESRLVLCLHCVQLLNLSQAIVLVSLFGESAILQLTLWPNNPAHFAVSVSISACFAHSLYLGFV